MKNFKIISVISAVLICIIAVACISAFVILCKSGIDPNSFKITKPNENTASAVLKESYDYGEGYIKSTVFVGDRTMAGITQKNALVSHDLLWTGEDGTLKLDHNIAKVPIINSKDQQFPSVSDAAAVYRPAYMIITVGLDNGVGYCTEEKFKEYYQSLISSIKESSPDTRIILQSVFPVSRDAEKKDPSISNDRIEQVNEWMIELCEETSIKYLDTHSSLKDKRGYLKGEYDSGDGITLNEAGYAHVLLYIRTHGYK